MLKSEWKQFKSLIDLYKTGKINRQDFCLYWAMAQKAMGV